jgi:hypothetical protein
VREGWVVVFPADPRYWAHAVSEGGRFSAARVSVTGAFEIDALLPADYFVAAVDDPSIDGWPMESWLATAAEGAARATLGRGETRTLSPIRLRTIPVERDPVREHRRLIEGSFVDDWSTLPAVSPWKASCVTRRVVRCHTRPSRPIGLNWTARCRNPCSPTKLGGIA